MVHAAPAVYRCGLTDSSRWQEFQLRPDDIVISVPSKCGTTWMQMICALLIFQTPDLPTALTTVSPWLDMFLRPIADVTRTLDAQQHRLLASTDQAPAGPPTTPARPANTRERVLRWIDDPRPATENLDSLRTVVHHLGQAWDRRSEPAVILLHHADLCRDLAGQMRRLADRLGIRVPRNRWPILVEAATFTSMRAKADQLVPDERLKLFTSNSAFFRSGKPGQWSEVLNDADLAAYDSLIRSLADPDFVDWAENGTQGS